MKILTLLITLLLPASAEIKVLRNFTLIDGSGGPAVAGAAMLIDNGRIVRIGSAQRMTPPDGAQVIDLDGKFVMPGIINLHGHVGNTVDLTQNAKFFTRENIEKNLRTYASYGVTTVLSLGTDQDLIFQIRDQQRAGRPTYTRVFTAGQGFTLKGGVGGMPSVTFNLENAAEVPKDIDALAVKKVDIVKVWVDDSFGHRPKIPFEITKAIIDNAHRHGLRVNAHVFYLADAKQLVNAGLDALAHSVRDQPVDQELIDTMKQHGTWQSAATLTREASMFIYAKPAPFLTDPFFTRSVSPAAIVTLSDPDYQKKIAADPDFPKYSGLLEMAQKNLKRLADAGIPFGMGTDTGVPGRFPGYFEQWEMELMVDAGLTPWQVIKAATKSSAEFLHAKDLGTLEAGKWADLIVLGADPRINIRNLRTIEAVYIAGNQVVQ
ncbi:MAG TPA: amidohydrolase family protein [Bryobacteraceae bacterium]|jgi:imidazolonepropionase-like amidohydrolase|nr:amidohydrolase family protein [Bryobacteraceae bacterium]